MSKTGGQSARGIHRLTVAMTCPRLWALTVYHGLRSKHPSPWALTGTLGHTRLAFHYAQKLKGGPPEHFRLDKLDAALAADAGDRDDLVELTKDIYGWYCERYAHDPWQPVMVEEEIRFRLGDLSATVGYPDAIVTARVDLIVEENGELFVVDHKFQSGEWGRARLAPWGEDSEYNLSPQVFLGLQLARRLFAPRPVEGFIVQRILRKRPYDSDRHICRPSALAYKEMLDMAVYAIEREHAFAEMIANRVALPPGFGSCIGRYGACDFAPVCHAEDHEERAMRLKRDYFPRLG